MYLIKYILYLALFSCTYGRPSVSKFRTDYTYSQNLNNYYKLHVENTNWQAAVAKCNSEGAQLFYPEDEAEAREVKTLLEPWSSRIYIWIGVSDLRSDEVYETIDGRHLNEVHHRWDSDWDEPDRSNGSHCVVMWKAYELWLKPCSDQNSFICKFNPGDSQVIDNRYSTPRQLEITDTVAIRTTTPPAIVDNPRSESKSNFQEDYIYSANTNSYYKLHEEKSSWQDAVTKCNVEGAQLFYPEDEAEASEVHNLLEPWSARNYIWIGVSDLQLDEVYETIDGRPLNEVHRRWDSDWGEPDRSTGGHCVIMWNKYELWLKPCSDKNSFICKYASRSSHEGVISYTTPSLLGITETPTEAIKTTSPSSIKDSSQFDGLQSMSQFRADYIYSAKTHNYYKLHEDKNNWQDAVAKCNSEGGQLFYPEDEAEAREVKSLLEPWSSRNYIWIGVSDLRLDEVYETIDGRSLNEVHHQWDSDWYEPDRSTGGHCVIMWSAYELWLKPCINQNSFICKFAPGNNQESGIRHTTPSLLEITETTPVVVEATTSNIIDNMQLGNDISLLLTEVMNDKPGSHVHFGNLIGEELKKFTPQEKLQIMVSILEIIQGYEHMDEQIEPRVSSQYKETNLINVN